MQDAGKPLEIKPSKIMPNFTDFLHRSSRLVLRLDLLAIKLIALTALLMIVLIRIEKPFQDFSPKIVENVQI